MLIFLSLIISQNSFAASSWSSQPSWAQQPNRQAPSQQSYSQRKSYRQEISRETQPFAPDSHNLALDIGQVFLLGSTGDKYDDNIGYQVHYTYGVSEMFGWDSSFGYSSHSDGKFSNTALLSGVRMNLSWFDKVVPYVNAGLGFYKPTYQLSDYTDTSALLFGIHMGGGVTLVLNSQFFFGTSLTFHDMFGTRKETPQGMREIDGTYTSFLLNVGTTF